MTHNIEYVYAGYGAAVVVLATYVMWVLRRGRNLSKQLPPEDRRWM
jgi:heme exporter protein CcmD